MSGAVILADQPTGAGPGVAGEARNDMWKDHVVNLSCPEPGNTSYHWYLLGKPLDSVAALSSPENPTDSFTMDKVGTYRVRLVTNGGGPGNTQTRVYRCRYDSTGVLLERGWALPAVDEQIGEANYDGNERHWSEPWETIVADIRGNLGGGGSSITLGGDLGDWDPASDEQQRVVGIDTVSAPLATTAADGLFVRASQQPIDPSPRAAIRDGDELWLGNFAAGEGWSLSDKFTGKVTRINLATDTVIAAVQVFEPAGGTIGQGGVIDLAQDDDYVYVLMGRNYYNQGVPYVAIISKTTNAIVGWGTMPHDTDATWRSTRGGVCADNAGYFYVSGAYDFGGTRYGIVVKFVVADCLGAAIGAAHPILEQAYGDLQKNKLRYFAGHLWLTEGHNPSWDVGVVTLRKILPSDLSVVATSVETTASSNVIYDGTHLYVAVFPHFVNKYDTNCALQATIDTTLRTEGYPWVMGMDFDDQGTGRFFVTGEWAIGGALLDSAGAMSVLDAWDLVNPLHPFWGDVVGYGGDFIVTGYEQDLSD